jgi:hypothetical protein
LEAFKHLPTGSYFVAALNARCHAQISDMDRAKIFVAECLSKRPDSSTNRRMMKDRTKTRPMPHIYSDASNGGFAVISPPTH